jgi:electron transfer flavoprotein alpha subunit
MRILILAEHDNRTLSLATRSAITAAGTFGGPIDVLLTGYNCAAIRDELAHIAGVQTVLVCDDPAFDNPLAEPISAMLHTVAGEYDVILAAATAFGKNTLPRLSALMDIQQVSDVISIIDDHTFVRPIYAGNANATVQAAPGRVILSIRPTAFPPAPDQEAKAAIKALPPVDMPQMPKFIERRVIESVRPDLTSANIVVAGGRGIGSDHAFNLISQLADTLGGAVGASRAAVDAGFIPNDAQVGQTGKIVAPDLYIAVGISGAIQHLAGMKDSRIIVAINKDEEAPIFQVADYGLVADIFEAVPELIDKLDA